MFLLYHYANITYKYHLGEMTFIYSILCPFLQCTYLNNKNIIKSKKWYLFNDKQTKREFTLPFGLKSNHGPVRYTHSL